MNIDELCTLIKDVDCTTQEELKDKHYLIDRIEAHLENKGFELFIYNIDELVSIVQQKLIKVVKSSSELLKSYDITIGLIDLGHSYDTIHIFGYKNSDEDVKEAIRRHIEATNKYNGAKYSILEIIR